MPQQPLSLQERDWLLKVCPEGPRSASAENWISEATSETPYIDILNADTVVLDGAFTDDQLLALVGVLRIRQGKAAPLPD
jgi:hypothetical protein